MLRVVPFYPRPFGPTKPRAAARANGRGWSLVRFSFGAAAGAVQAGDDLGDHLVLAEIEELRHQGDDGRLRDGLPESDGQGIIVVGLRIHGAIDEEVSRHPAKGVEDASVGNAIGAQHLDKPFNGDMRIQELHYPVLPNDC